MTWLILLGLLVLVAWAGAVLRRVLRLPGLIRGISRLDPNPDMTELLALRQSGEIDEATYERLRDRFERRREAQGLRARGGPFTPVMQSRPLVEELDERLVP